MILTRPRKAGERPAAALYCRVSTQDQASNGVSMEVQEDRLRAYCRSRGWRVVSVHRDGGYSGKDLERPGVKRFLAEVESGRLGAVVVLKLDRLTRSVRDLADLIAAFEKKHVALVSLTESLDTGSAAGRAMVNMIGVFSQWEREVIGERIASALRHKKSRLEVYGGTTPLGFRRVGDRLVRVPSETRAVRLILRMRRRGLSLRAIAARLAERRIRTKTGGRWYASTVRAILGNTIHAVGRR